MVVAESLQARCEATGDSGVSGGGLAPLPEAVAAQLDWQASQPPVKIFATDAHRDSLQVAGAGLYDAAAMTMLSEERRIRFFEPRGDRFVIDPRLRRLVVFAPHDMTRDPPFTQLDLVACRNVLIYFKNEPQQQALRNFHFALRPDGCLWLGPSETTGELKSHFEPIDSHWKIYRRTDAELPKGEPPPVPGRSTTIVPAGGPSGSGPTPGSSTLSLRTVKSANPPATPPAPDSLLAAYDLLLGRFMPPSILTDSGMQVLHVFAGCEGMLRPPTGRPTRYLPDLVDSDLRGPLLAAAARCRDLTSPVAVRAGVADDQTLSVERMSLPGQQPSMLLFRLTDAASSQNAPAEPAPQPAIPPPPPGRPPDHRTGRPIGVGTGAHPPQLAVNHRGARDDQRRAAGNQ